MATAEWTFDYENVIPIETKRKTKKLCLHAASMHMGGILSASIIAKTKIQTPIFLFCSLKARSLTRPIDESINQSAQNEALHHKLVTNDSDPALHAFDTHLRAVVSLALAASTI